MKTEKLLDNLIIFYENEKTYLAKTKLYMKKIYKNRVEQNYNGDKHLIEFLFDKIGYYHFTSKDTIEEAEKLLYGFYQLSGRKELNNAMSDYLSFRTTNIKG